MIAGARVKIIKPAILKNGDRVGLVSPASRPTSPSVVKKSAWLLEQTGLHAIVGENVLKSEGLFGATDQERLDDLNRFILDPHIKAIYCLNGGYGSLRLLDKLDFDVIREHPKVFVGSDDVTTLLLAIHKMTGLVTMHGPNLERIQTLESMQEVKTALTKPQLGPLMVDEPRLEKVDKKNPDVVKVSAFAYAPVAGQAEGRIVGGNLTALVSLMGTPFQPEFANTILLLEDIDERFDILDRWFSTLYVAGALEATLAVAFGKFENCHAKGEKSTLSLEDMLSDRLVEMHKACCFNFAFGQSSQSQFVPIGVRAAIDTAQGRIDYLESAYKN
jgi:muramoyltetrapeptide carboxypeptidase